VLASAPHIIEQGIKIGHGVSLTLGRTITSGSLTIGGDLALVGSLGFFVFHVFIIAGFDLGRKYGYPYRPIAA
jgi:hypothetical protein